MDLAFRYVPGFSVYCSFCLSICRNLGLALHRFQGSDVPFFGNRFWCAG